MINFFLSTQNDIFSERKLTNYIKQEEGRLQKRHHAFQQFWQRHGPRSFRIWESI